MEVVDRRCIHYGCHRFPRNSSVLNRNAHLCQLGDHKSAKAIHQETERWHTCSMIFWSISVKHYGNKKIQAVQMYKDLLQD